MTTWTRAALLVAVLAAVAWLVSPALAIVVALALVSQDVWGWATGRRRTLLEDAFGPFPRRR